MIHCICAFIISLNTLLSINHIDYEIKQKQREIVSLSIEVQKAREVVGKAETPQYIEKIKIIQNLKDEIAQLREHESELKGG